MLFPLTKQLCSVTKKPSKLALGYNECIRKLNQEEKSNGHVLRNGIVMHFTFLSLSICSCHGAPLMRFVILCVYRSFFPLSRLN